MVAKTNFVGTKILRQNSAKEKETKQSKRQSKKQNKTRQSKNIKQSKTGFWCSSNAFVNKYNGEGERVSTDFTEYISIQDEIKKFLFTREKNDDILLEDKL